MPLQLLIKPASGQCNLRCEYCFYHDELLHRQTPVHPVMSRETIRRIVTEAYRYAQGSCHFVFQGGEPMLAGQAFFEHTVALQRKYAPAGMHTYNAIQTNGTLLDAAWAAFLRDHGFLVGVSLDGNAYLHDKYRHDASGGGTHARVMDALRCLKKYDVPFNILTVVTGDTAAHAGELYRFLMQKGLVYQQYIPCLDPMDGQRAPYSLTAEQYARFLRTLFDLWLSDRQAGRFVSVRYFENLAAMLLRRAPESCGMSGVCAPQFAIEANGDVYPCDFYMTDEYLLGNIHDMDFSSLSERLAASGFIERSHNLPNACRDCKVYPFCRGGCRRDRLTCAPNAGQNRYCDAYRAFLPYALPRIAALLPHKGKSGGNWEV